MHGPNWKEGDIGNDSYSLLFHSHDNDIAITKQRLILALSEAMMIIQQPAHHTLENQHGR